MIPGLPRRYAPRNDKLRLVVIREAWRTLFKAALAAALSFAPFHAAAEPSSRLPPLEHPGIAIDRQWPGCPGGPPSGERVAAIDFSKQADPEALDLSRALGATTILRYYDWAEGPTREKFDFYWEPGPTLPGKTLTQKERDLIFSKGFSLGVVFQHRSDLRKTFLDTKRAGFDARRALELAQELGQPKESVIFFSVDFDAREKNIEHVKRYFETVGEMVGAANFRVGVYRRLCLRGAQTRRARVLLLAFDVDGIFGLARLSRLGTVGREAMRLTRGVRALRGQFRSRCFQRLERQVAAMGVEISAGASGFVSTRRRV